MCLLVLFIAGCRAFADPDSGEPSVDSGDDTGGVDDSGTGGDSGDSGDDSGTPPIPGWSCTIDKELLNMSGLVAGWGDPATKDAVVVDGAGPIEAWTGSGWQGVASLVGGGRAVDGGTDGSVWVVGFSGSAVVRDGGTWTTIPLPTIEANIPVDVSVTSRDEAIVLSTAVVVPCTGCPTEKQNFVSMWDGSGFTTVEDPNDGTIAATSIFRLADGRYVVTGDNGYARLVDDGVWADIAVAKATDMMLDITQLSDGTLLAGGENGWLWGGTPEQGLVGIDTKWYGDFVAIEPDDSGGAWLLGSSSYAYHDLVTLFHWTGGVLLELDAGEGPWWDLVDGPSGELLVVGGEDGSVIGIATDKGIQIGWTVPRIAPIDDLAVADDGRVYSVARGTHGGYFAVLDGLWTAFNLGTGVTIQSVEPSPSGGVVLMTNDDAWTWDGSTATRETLPVEADHSFVGVVSDEDRTVAAGWAYYGDGERDLVLAIRDELGWSSEDITALPGVVLFSDAIDEDGTLWLAGRDLDQGYIASWTPETGPEVVLSGLASVALGMWPRGDGGLWVLLDGDDSDRGFYAFDGTTLSPELANLQSFTGVRAVLEAPGIGTLAAVTWGDDSAAFGSSLLVRSAPGEWSSIYGITDAVNALAVLDDGTVLAGTSTAVLRLDECHHF